jgi:hypothetical protein
MSIDPFLSSDHFRELFTQGLQRILHEPAAGAHILVHANACFDERILHHLKPALLQSFERIAQRYRGALANGRALEDAADDQTVFLKLMAIGFSGVLATEFRQLGGWELQFNHIRAFRPPRMTGEPVSGISRPFDGSAFHFNKPFLRKEVFWAGTLCDMPVELLYNKFPFAPLHGLLVPEREACLPQLLSRRHHDFVWTLCERLGQRLPGWGVAYNSYGAYASVNHLHFQSFIRPQPLPLASAQWQHNGGPQPYPLPCEVYANAGDAWQRIDSLHAGETAYNLVYLPGRLYCLPRRSQGSYSHAAWTGGFAWYELAGGFTAFNRADFDALEEADIVMELGKLRLPGEG